MSTSILLADDNKNIREFCKRELEDEGYQVRLAADGFEAIASFRGQSPDMVVLDIAMPILDGLQVLEQIRAIDPRMPVVLFSAYDGALSADPRSGLATACVQKRDDLSELKRAIFANLGDRRPPQICSERSSGQSPTQTISVNRNPT
jgi:CheY-like chemotaxis protein